MLYMQSPDDTSQPAVAPSTSEDHEAGSGSAPQASQETGDKFGKLLVDFMRDLLITFPELKDSLDANLLAVCAGSPSESTVTTLRDHCVARLPERFFDILYQNEDMFDNQDVDLCFFPGIDFRVLWQANITDNTRSTIWKYLQLFLFDAISDMTDGSSFGDTAKLFEAIDEDVFRSKLEETITQMQSMFEADHGSACPDGDGEESAERPDIPNPEEIHEHVSAMMDGKLGALAKEIAEETAQEMDIDIEDSGNINDVFKKLFKNPTKLMSLVQNVGSKIDKKLKDGNIKESELIEEATELIKKMKDTPGMGNLQEMFSKMGMPMPQGGKINTAAMQAHLQRNMRVAKQRERMQERQANKRGQESAPTMSPEEFQRQRQLADEAAMALLKSEGLTNGMETLKYTQGEAAPKSSKGAKPKKKKRKGAK
tara:strand:+ start:2568 stop:3845 length:1278 start_codon:yes stop_codon:yes gene_type:complete